MYFQPKADPSQTENTYLTLELIQELNWIYLKIKNRPLGAYAPVGRPHLFPFPNAMWRFFLRAPLAIASLVTCISLV